MNRTNLVLLVIFAIVFSIWFATMPDSDSTRTAAAPRLFPNLNKEAVDAIVIEGGWKGADYAYVRGPEGWVLASGGGFPVTTQAPREFIEAVASIRRDNVVGESADLAKTTRTDSQGRVVRVLSDGVTVARFVVGKHPQGDWQAYFLRAQDAEGNDHAEIYRTKTVTDEEAAKSSGGDPMMGARGPQAFDWAQYCDEVFKWTKTQIWNLDDGEIRELELVRPGDHFNVKLVREEEDNWTLSESGNEPVRADTSAVESITSGLAYLAFEEVVGASNDAAAREKYGLDSPVITLVITLRKKIEKPAGEEKEKEGEEEEKKDAEPESEYEIIKRTISVGSKVKMPRSIDDESGEVKEEELYAVKVSGDLDDPTKGGYIFLVNDYKIGPLKKPLEDLRLKEEEKKDEPSDDEPKEESKEDEPKDEPADVEPKDEPEDDEPKDESKVDEPKDEPEVDEPKDEPEPEGEPKDEPKEDEPTEPGR